MSAPPSSTRPLALVTGATAGIGAAFARRLARDGYDLVLVARDAPRLAAIAAELVSTYQVTAEPVAADLSTDDGCALVEERLKTYPFDLLVNNAGFSLNRPFLRSTPADEERLLRVNVHAVMRLTLAALPGMAERRRGAVINVSSVAGFAPLMPGSTYPASKAWVTNFSESVALAVRPYHVRVMALCPGYTRTEFHERAGIDVSRLPRWLWRSISVPGWQYKVAVFGMRHLPRGLVRIIARVARGRINPDRE